MQRIERLCRSWLKSPLKSIACHPERSPALFCFPPVPQPRDGSGAVRSEGSAFGPRWGDRLMRSRVRRITRVTVSDFVCPAVPQENFLVTVIPLQANPTSARRLCAAEIVPASLPKSGKLPQTLRSQAGWLVGWTVDIDVGGTLTDALCTKGEEVFCVKVDTTPHDLTV